MNTPSLKGQIHEEIEKIFRTLLPQNGLAVREEQIALCHIMLDALLKNNIALCDAGVGIGKTYAYLTGCILLRKNAPHSAVSSLPVLVSTYGDKLITLSTCEYSQNDGRLLVVAKKTED